MKYGTIDDIKKLIWEEYKNGIIKHILNNWVGDNEDIEIYENTIIPHIKNAQNLQDIYGILLEYNNGNIERAKTDFKEIMASSYIDDEKINRLNQLIK